MSDSTGYFTGLGPENPFSIKAKEIIAKELFGKIPVEEPIMLFTIGCPGSGKTSLLSTIADECKGDPSQIRHVVHRHLQDGGFSYQPSSMPKELGNALYVNGLKYRDEISEDFLKTQGLIKGQHYAVSNDSTDENPALNYMQSFKKSDPDTRKVFWDVPAEQEKIAENFLREKGVIKGTDYKDSAWGYVSNTIWKTGSDVALGLILHAATEGINCVLDSTGGGFAPPKERVTEPLIKAAQRSNTQLIFLALEVDRETAFTRVESDYKNGKKPNFNPEAIDTDIGNVPKAVGCLTETAKEMGFDRISIVHLNKNLQVDRSKTSSPWVSGTVRDPGKIELK